MIKFVSITNPYDVKFETEIINRLFEEGLEELHIRKPTYSKAETIAYIQQIDAKYHHKIVLYHHYQLIHQFAVKGIHIDKDFMNSSLLKWFLQKMVLRNKKIKIYYSVSHISHIDKYAEKADCLLLGPIYTPTSQHSYHASIDMEKLHYKLKDITTPVILMGGINLQNYTQFTQYNIEGIALQTYLWKSMDIIKSFKAIVEDYRNPQAKVKLKVV